MSTSFTHLFVKKYIVCRVVQADGEKWSYEPAASKYIACLMPIPMLESPANHRAHRA